jgi:hypothetical protein
MTEKQKLIEAFKSLDFEALDNLLDDDRSYMDVTKDLFLSTLKQELENHSDLNSYEKVVEGFCKFCNKGCKAYKFKAENSPSLNLFFEEKNGKVTDIYLCNALEVETPDENESDIFFSFYEEEKVDFKPTTKYLIHLQKIEKSVEEFNNLASIGLVPVEEVVHWYNKTKVLANEIQLNAPFKSFEYKAHEYIDSIYSKVSSLVHYYNENHIAQKALREYQEFDKENEKMLISWLLNYREDNFFPLKKTVNWEKTGIIILETEPEIVIDCLDCLDSFLFDEIYYKHYNEMMTKYEPTKEQYKLEGDFVPYSLESYLKIHNKYLDLL